MDSQSLIAGFIMGIMITIPFISIGLIIYFVKRVAAKSVS